MESKCPNYYYKALGQLHEILKKKEIKVIVRKEIKIENARALDPLKKLNWNWKLIKLSKGKNLFLEFLYLWNLMRKLIINGNPNSILF